MTVYEALTTAQNLVIERGKRRKVISVEDEIEDIDTIIELTMLKSKYRPTKDRKGE